ncbi:MAG: SoxR reducing system RseC family protein [Bacteroidaceae bacterium]|nr:SoxR reducing system RseC family protein [Bacteroidaceae bacterium]
MSKAQETISHRGVVMEIAADGLLKVKILQATACASCSAKSLCSSAESKEKIVDAWNTDNAPIEIGQEVSVEGSRSGLYSSVASAYALPLLTLMAVLFISYWLTGNETISAICSLIVLIPYFVFVLKRMDRKYKQKFMFKAKVIDQGL